MPSLHRLPVLAAVVVIAAVTYVLEPAFLGPTNLVNIVVQATTLSVVALGMTFVIIGGGIDLSVGSTMALCGVITGVVIESGGPLPLALLGALTGGLAIGGLNGFLSTKVGLAPFLATLGTMGIARGGAFLLSGGQPISGPAMSLGGLFSINGFLPPSVYLVLLIFGVGSISLHYTAWGRRLYAVGSNERAALLAGVNIQRHRAATYMIAGVAAALGGIFITARLQSAQPLAGSLYELDAIAAAVIGGGSLNGGRGDLLGTLLGVLLIAELRNAVTILGLPSHAQPLVIGVLLIVAVTVDARQRRNSD